jgi:hypothetical protein
MAERREPMVTQWANWLGDRLTSAPSFPRALTERQLRLLIEALTEMVGPMRREVKPVWYSACEQYGRMAAARGLAAGEVVEEIQYLREVLIRHLSPVLAAMRARQGMATMLRLNRVVDKGVSTAVVGYTDALIATLFVQNGVPRPDTELDATEIGRQLDTLDEELTAATRPNGRSPAA